jgi:hypothetical protein
MCGGEDSDTHDFIGYLITHLTRGGGTEYIFDVWSLGRESTARGALPNGRCRLGGVLCQRNLTYIRLSSVSVRKCSSRCGVRWNDACRTKMRVECVLLVTGAGRGARKIRSRHLYSSLDLSRDSYGYTATSTCGFQVRIRDSASTRRASRTAVPACRIKMLLKRSSRGPNPDPCRYASPPRLHFPRLAASPTQSYDASTRTNAAT